MVQVGFYIAILAALGLTQHNPEAVSQRLDAYREAVDMAFISTSKHAAARKKLMTDFLLSNEERKTINNRIETQSKADALHHTDVLTKAYLAAQIAIENGMAKKKLEETHTMVMDKLLLATASTDASIGYPVRSAVHQALREIRDLNQ